MATWKKVITESDDANYKNENLTLAQLDTALDGASGYGANKVLKVNGSGNAIEWADDSTVSNLGSLSNVTDGSSASNTGFMLVGGGSGQYHVRDIIGDIDVAANGTVSLTANAVATANIADDNVTYAKMQDVSTDDRLLGAVTAGTVSEVQLNPDMINHHGTRSAGEFLEFSGTSTGLTWTGVVKLTDNQTIAGTKTFSDNVIVTGDLTVNGATTTVSTNNLVVQDKLVVLGVPDSEYANEAAAQAGANGGGILLHSDNAGSESKYASVTWNSSGRQTGWEVEDTDGVGKYTITTTSYSTSTPTTDLNGVGGFHLDASTGAETLYVRVA